MTEASESSEQTYLLVPMCLEALVVGDKGPQQTDWIDQTPAFSRINLQNVQGLGREIVPRLFDARFEPYPPGVHLHWALPAAFTHARPPSDTSTAAPQFPLVPNRWFVLRLHTAGPGEALATRAWIVESDYLDAAKGKSPWLVKTALVAAYEYTRLGRTADYATWNEPHTPLFLRAVGPGNPAFAASYRACQSVFGLYDDMEGVAAGPQTWVTYLVAGWYSDPGQDLLRQGLTAGKTLATLLEEFRWSLPEQRPGQPTRLLCHGMLHSVPWRGPDADYPSGVPGTPVEMAVGNTLTEALATLVQAKLPATLKPQVEQALGSWQYALLKKYGLERTAADGQPADQQERSPAPPGYMALQDGQHQKTFAASDGGSLWDIQPKDPQGPLANGRADTKAPALPSDVLDSWRRINQQQRVYDQWQREADGLGWELYAQWYKRRRLSQRRWPDQQVRRTVERNLDDSIRRLQDILAPLQTKITALQTEISTLAVSIRQRLESDTRLREFYELITTAMPRFYRAYEPVVLLSGLQPSAKYRQQSDGALVCRVSGQTITSLKNLPVPGNQMVREVRVEARDLQRYATFPSHPDPVPIPAAIQGLFLESLLLDPHCATLIARAAYAVNGVADPRLPQVEQLSQVIAETQRQPAAAQFGDMLNRLPTFAVRPWQQAWTPLFLAWEVDWYPSYRHPLRAAAPAPEAELQGWRLRDSLDYTWVGGPPAPDPAQALRYRGYLPLSPYDAQSLEERRRTFPALRFLFEPVAAASLLGQRLNGLYDAMLMREHSLQFPPLQEQSLAIDQHLQALVGDQHYASPVPDNDRDFSSFVPIRAGHLSFARLWVVDAFGQSRKVLDRYARPAVTAPVHLHHSLVTPAAAARPLLQLLPRLNQPARLLFRWVSAADARQESDGHTSTQPVCGWVVPNRLDKSFVIYNADGHELGAVQLVDDPAGWQGKAVRWAQMPSAALDATASPGRTARPTADEIPNAPLRRLVNWLLRLNIQGAPTLTDFLGRLEAVSQSMPPSAAWAQGHVAGMIGRPLVVVRATVQLQLDAPPALDQSWIQAEAPHPWQHTPPAEPRGFTRVGFPVRLGAPPQGGSGLIGYFVDTEAEDVMRLHDSRDDLFLTCDAAADPVMLTLLMEPQAGVHISSGILPTKCVTLPPHGIAEALANLDLTFLAAPLLAGVAEPPTMPLPTDVPGDWYWIAPTAEGPLTVEPIGKEQAKTSSLFRPMQLYEGWVTLRKPLRKQ
jgi:hypothetical protein